MAENLSDILFRLVEDGAISEHGMRSVLAWRESALKGSVVEADNQVRPAVDYQDNNESLSPEQRQARTVAGRQASVKAMSLDNLQLRLSSLPAWSAESRVIEAEIKARLSASAVPAARPSAVESRHQVTDNVDSIRLEALVNKAGKSDADWAEMRRLMGGK